MEDWKTHLNTLFPEVRLKKTIEVRGADVQSTDLACALPALWTGILYDDRALAEAEALVEGWTHDEVADLRTRAWRDGLRATFRGGSLVGIAAAHGRDCRRGSRATRESSTPRAARTSACTWRACESWSARDAAPPTRSSRVSTAADSTRQSSTPRA